MNFPLKLALVGYGHMGQGHQLIINLLPALRSKLKITGVFEPHLAFQQKAREKKLKIFDTFDSLIGDKDIDGIIISSPPQYHCEQVVSALEAGKHVYSEIPMALDESEILRIINAEKTSKKKYQCGENYIFYAEVLYAAHLVETKKIGRSVYAEAEYLHDITYRWRDGGSGGPEKKKVDSWYARFDPLAYAHSIGPAQVALGGLKSPMPFIEVTSYANDLGGDSAIKTPICAPAKAFHVALFRTPTGAVAKCANAYIFAREPNRMGIQVTGELGTFEAPAYGRGGRLFLADDHVITSKKHRKGTVQRVGRWNLLKGASHGIHPYISANVRIMNDWVDAIKNDKKPSVHASVAGNMCIAGIIASEAARENKIKQIPLFT